MGSLVDEEPGSESMPRPQSRVDSASEGGGAASSRPQSQLSQLSDRLSRMGQVISRGTPSGTPSAGLGGLTGATPPSTAPVPEVVEVESPATAAAEAERPEPKKRAGRTPRRTPRHGGTSARGRSVSPEPEVDWVDALGRLDDPSKTPRAWEAEPVSVGVVRKQYRLRRKGEEAAIKARLRRNKELGDVYRKRAARGDGGGDDDDASAAPDAAPPVVVDDPDIKRMYGLAYRDIVDGAGTKERLVAQIERELRDGAPVLLVAAPEDNDGEPSSCRLALRTLHAGCNPTLTDPIPPMPLTRADGSVAMKLEPKRQRAREFPLPIPAALGQRPICASL